jgi:hypothetical protein
MGLENFANNFESLSKKSTGLSQSPLIISSGLTKKERNCINEEPEEEEKDGIQDLFDEVSEISESEWDGEVNKSFKIEGIKEKKKKGSKKLLKQTEREKSEQSLPADQELRYMKNRD